MKVLQGLKPEKVFDFFETICGIPHGSDNEQKLSDWLSAFAKERNLECHQDEMGNIIIVKEASAGFEQSMPVALQGHMDMVCNQEEDCTKDMAVEGLDLAVDGDLIFARGTTLGGDDGIAVAYMLALLDDETLAHPRMECIFTVQEESGLYGAEALDVSPLTAKRFINIDSEDEGVLTVGCAGGVDVITHLPVDREAFDGELLDVKLSGLIGGHSGTEINRGQENAVKSLGRLLWELQEDAGARLVHIQGGVADNVIPVSANATIAVPSADRAKAICDAFRKTIDHEYKMDPEAAVSVSPASSNCLPMDADSTLRVIAYLIGTPNGIEKMTKGIDGLPQTSLSLGVVNTVAGEEKSGSACGADAGFTGQDHVDYTFCIRSSVDSECDMVARRLECQARVLGAYTERVGAYPGWEYAPESPLRDLVCQVYKEQSGKDMVIEAIHAGLECGYFAGKISGLDCVSIGPDLRGVHTPAETMSISSVQRTWELVKEVLARMK